MKIKIKPIVYSMFLSFIGILSFLLSNNIEDRININLDELFKNAQAQTETGTVAVCLKNYLYVSNKYVKNGKKCYTEAIGPDIFEGYVVSCLSGGSGCQPTYCDTKAGCYSE